MASNEGNQDKKETTEVVVIKESKPVDAGSSSVSSPDVGGLLKLIKENVEVVRKEVKAIGIKVREVLNEDPTIIPDVKSEEKVAYLWNKCFETALLKTAIGASAGTLLGFAMFRGRVNRSLVAGLGTGIGIGSAWTSCQTRFETLWSVASNPPNVDVMKKL